MRITSTKTEVARLLKSTPTLRDDDNKLLSNVWFHYLKANGFDPNEMTGRHLLTELYNGNLPNQESVRRMRQKLQEVDPSLRGKYYKNKKTKQVEKVKTDLKIIKTDNYE